MHNDLVFFTKEPEINLYDIFLKFIREGNMKTI